MLPCDPRRRLHRYLILIVICLLSFGTFFCYDNPAALQDVMRTDLNLTATQFMGLYALYSGPNVVFSITGGFLVDRFLGIRLGSIIFSLFIVVGQLLFAGGAFFNRLWLMYLARFIFGMGGGPLAASQNTYASLWFRGNEFNIIFGLQVSMSRIGSTVNMNVMQSMYGSSAWPSDLVGNRRLGACLLVAIVTCLLSLTCAITLAYLDLRANRILNKVARTTASGNRMRLTDILKFPIGFWLLCLISIVYYVAVLPLISLALVFFERKYQLLAGSADLANSLMFAVSVVTNPIVGFIMYFVGKNLFFVIAGILCTIVCHILFAFTYTSPHFIMVLLGIGYSMLASSLWPVVAFLLPQHQRGTAYGIMQSALNLGLAVGSLITGYIVDISGYFILCIFFILCLCVALLFTIGLYFWDIEKYGGRLNFSASERRNYEESQLNKSDKDTTAT